MGYDTYVTGALKVTPKLSEAIVEALGLDGDEGDLIAVTGGADDTVGLVVDPTGAQTIGVIPGESWTEIVVQWDDSFNAGDLGEQVERIVERVRLEGCTITGALYLDGEGSFDFSRYRVEGGKVIHEIPEFVWPNEDRGWNA